MPRFVRGLRVTDDAGLEVVTAVLGGLVNTSLVAQMMKLGGRAAGLNGAADGLFQAEVADPALGWVGSIVNVNTALVLALLAAGFIPVVAPVSLHCSAEAGRSLPVLNVNADTAAGELARALGAERLIFLTDVEGVLDSSKRLIPRLSTTQARRLIGSGVAAGGMIPKLDACLRALGSVASTQIIDGRRPGALLEAMEDRKIGTRIE